MALPDFEMLVERFYQPLFRFAVSLSRDPDTASDLTQQTFCIWAEKGHQIREPDRVKTWLFTTLYREFLSQRRRASAHPHEDLDGAEAELPVCSPQVVDAIDGKRLVQLLHDLDETFRAPLVLFYLQDHSYREIAEILDIPVGTVMSRLSRGKDQLRQRLVRDVATPRLVRFPDADSEVRHG